MGEAKKAIDKCNERLEAIAAKFGADKMTERAYDKANEPAMKEFAQLEAGREELTGGNPEGPTEPMTREEAAAKWDGADVAEKRALLLDALGPDALCVEPSDKIGFRVQPGPGSRQEAQEAQADTG